MSVLLWNVRGINLSTRQSDFRKILYSINPSIVCLVETKVKRQNSQRIEDIILLDWLYANNYDSNPTGRIWVMWNALSWTCTIQQSTNQVITLDAVNKGGFHC